MSTTPAEEDGAFDIIPLTMPTEPDAVATASVMENTLEQHASSIGESVSTQDSAEHIAVDHDTAAPETMPEPTVRAPIPIPTDNALRASFAQSVGKEVFIVPSVPPAVEPTTEPVPAIEKKVNPARGKRLSGIMLALLLVSIAAPLLLVAGEGIHAYTTYTALQSDASNGVHHLLAVKDMFADVKAHPATALEASTLSQAKQEMLSARMDFSQMQLLIDRTALIQTITHYLPQYRLQVTTARAASQIGIDVSNIGLSLFSSAIILAPKLSSPLAGDTKSTQTPLITQNDLNVLGSTLDAILPPLDDIQKQAPSLSLDALPESIISLHQREQVRQALQLLPQVETLLIQGRNLLPQLGWLLGVNSSRTFLVQTMDRAELRPTGGFTGQYGELQIQSGRVAPFSLHDISLIEYADNSPTTDQLPPQSYRSWWPFANWGLRDSNLSADFPTSAQIAMNQYHLEVHHNVDGVILFTPFLIEHVLQILGPVQIPEYQETITAQNLEERLHYYQLDNAGIAKQLQVQTKDTSTSDRKQFTALVARTLLDRVRHASSSELLAIAQEIPHDLQTKDLQIYLADPQLENLLMQYGDAGQIDRSTTHDGIYVVQANVSASKASQYVRTTMHDVVTLDANGGATHVMQLRLAYTQIGPVYGLDTYRDYVRIYVPPSAHFLWGTGFDTGQPLCSGPLAPCADNGIYPQNELVCPTGQYQAGASAPMLNDPYAGAWHPLDAIGPPTNFKSDQDGRAMFGGYIIVPKNCTMTATLSWYVPAMGNNPYQLLVQRQAGTFPELDLTMLATPGDCAQLAVQGKYFDGVLSQDASFTLPRTATQGGTNSCYPQPQV
jgi:hypothetical protein